LVTTAAPWPADQPAVAERRNGKDARLLDLDPGVLAAHPANIRFDLGDLIDLAARIREAGVIEPLVVAHSTPKTRVKLTVAGIGSWSGTAGARPRSPPSPLRSRRGWAAVSGFRCRRRRADLMAATRSPASSRATVHSRLGPRPERAARRGTACPVGRRVEHPRTRGTVPTAT
jgi:hypothetical protein